MSDVDKSLEEEEITLSDRQFHIKEKMLKEVSSIRGVALIVTFTALVFLSTSIFFIYIPASNGFFNIGEAFVYLAALIGGPITGAISGGLGASMADLALAYGQFAPGTAVLKFLEGFVVGSVFHYSRRIPKWIKFAFIGLICAFLIGFSSFLFNESFDLGMAFYNLGEVAITVPGYVFLIISIILSTLVLLVLFLLKEKGEMALSCILGGIIIVVGYFLYETYILSYEASQAALEIPFNIAQVIFGAAIAIPIVSYLRELGVIDIEMIKSSKTNEKDIKKTKPQS